MRKISLIMITFLLLVSCKREALNPAKDQEKVVTAHFSFTTAPMQLKGVATRSTPSTTVDDQQITDIWVLQFDNSGNFIKKSYTSPLDPAAFDVPLVANASGTTSNIYFIANIGSILASPLNEATFKTQVKAIAGETDLFIAGSGGKKSIPMFGQLLTQIVPASGYMETMNVTLTRMLAEVDLTYTVDASIASTFTLEKVRVCNVPTGMQYYAPGTGNFPTTPTPSTVINLPLETATAPGPTTVTFFLPDNRRGMGANTAGTNERLKSGVDYATYIELIGHTKGVQGGDEISYRIYPGADNYNDYNLVRNTKYALSTTLKGISASDNRVRVKERSNCYMIKPRGSVNIPVKHANDSDLGTQIPNVTTGWTSSVYWNTIGTGCVTTTDNLSLGYFTVTAPTGNAGSAEVVIRNGSGNVLWSWHIWVTDYDPSYAANVDAQNGYTWMRMNLGATTVPATDLLTASGMFYQWGRKDPFPPSNYFGNFPAFYNSTIDFPGSPACTATGSSNNVNVKYTDAGASPISYTNQLAYSVKYPMLFLTNWAGSTATSPASSTTGIDSWGGEYGQPKSVYDPCPEGWRVPSGKKTSTTWASPWSTFTTYNGSAFNGSAGYGVWNNITFPAGGAMASSSGTFDGVGGYGSYWSATAYVNLAFGLNLNSSGPTPSNGPSRSFGFNVRCVKNQ